MKLSSSTRGYFVDLMYRSSVEVSAASGVGLGDEEAEQTRSKSSSPLDLGCPSEAADAIVIREGGYGYARKAEQRKDSENRYDYSGSAADRV